LRDTIAHLNTNQFYRLRIGIGHPGNSSLVLNYVLGNPSIAQRQAIDEGLSRVLALLPDIIDGHIQHAMKQLHTLQS
jgi:PTH1 family peptidyl-tRNA hydrolase